MRRSIDFLLDNCWLVGALLLLLLVSGLKVMLSLPLEAFPDLTNNQVVVTAQCPGLSPVEVEKLVTYPLEVAMLGMPKLQTVRSVSKLELSMVTVIFDDGMDKYLARQLVGERLSQARERLPSGVQPQMNPMSTAFGEVYQYTVASPSMSLMEIKTLQDWDIRHALLTIPGVSEINSWGGETRQMTLLVEPESLRRYDLTVHDVVSAVAANNVNFGGSSIEHAQQQWTIRGLGRAESPQDLASIVIAVRAGVPVLLGQVATIGPMPLLRHGAVMKDGKGETVSGMVIILRGENGQRILEETREKIAHLELPGDARIIPFYDQSDVIDATIHTVKKNLLEAAVLVALVLLVFLLDWRAALVVASTIPLSLLFGFLGMGLFGISINLMSLGAIDFGTIVDGSVVMVENAIHRLEGEGGRKDLSAVVRDAAHEVSRPIVFGVLIIIAVYLPVLTLQSLEGRMFRPMAVTVVSALAGSLLLALFAVPTLSTLALRRRARAVVAGKKSEVRWFEKLRARYRSSLLAAERHRRPVVLAAAALVVVALGSLKWIGTEFMPTLDEGSMVITSKRLPGIALSESIRIGNSIEKVIKSFPEVAGVVTKLGRPDLATEAMGENESDSYVSFTTEAKDAGREKKDALAHRMEEELSKIPGVTYEITQPMQMRMDETITGTRGDVALKIFGEDLDTLEQLGRKAQALIQKVPGASETQMELTSGAEELQIRIDRAAAARFGVNVADVQEVIESLYGSKQVSEMLIGDQRFPIALRLPARLRNDPEALKGLQLKTPQGELVRLDALAEIRAVRGPIVVNRDEAHRRIVVMSNVSGRDLGGFVKDAEAAVGELQIPKGYRLEWGGQFENQRRAQQRLLIVFPISLLIISALLYATFRSGRQMLLILLIVPLSLVGGIAALWLRGIHLNLSACVGFIALFGIAVLNGVVMVSHINALRKGGAALDDAVAQGASDRLRPVLMTALVASLGFIPMALASSRGAEVQRPLATVVIGGLVTATLLTLYVLPLLYPWFSKRLPADRERAPAESA